MRTRPPSASRRGSALLVCLAVVLLLAVVIVAFLSQAQLNRQTENSGAARTKAEILARSGLDYAVSRLIAEITDPANSEKVADGVYRPLSGEKMRPAPQLQRAAVNLRMVHVPGLLKQSIAAFDPAASAVNTATADKSGRSVGPKRWNAPMFYFSQPQFTSAAQVPDWIYFSADGPSRSAPVLGRIAFNIYEIDGLLDVNVAGYPVQLNGDIDAINSLKATVAGADVKKISRYISYLDQSLVDNRSRGSVRSEAYVSSVRENTNGFLAPAPGDTHFLSRLDLVRYAITFGFKAGAANQLDTNAMAFVTAWSRSLDAPSWNPPAPGEANLFAPAIRRTSDVTITDYLLDGRTRTQKWKKGDAVAARRFPLSRIGWFDHASSDNRARAIRQFFGLDPMPDGTWKYFDVRIRTLDELRTADREPNFFELLKAGIASGSLGRALPSGQGRLSADRDGDKDLQVLRIGASIIDAATAGNEPTIIAFEPSVDRTRFACGVKDLPYLYAVRFRQIVKTDATGTVERIDQFALPILVNPHASPATPEARQATRPAVRMRMIGTIENPVADAGGATGSPLESRFPKSAPDDPQSLGNRILEVDPAAFRTPSPITSRQPPDAAPMPPDFAGTYRGFWLATGAVGGDIVANAPGGRANFNRFNLVLEYWNGRSWIIYDALVGDGREDPAAGLGETVEVEFASTTEKNPKPDDASFTGAGTWYLVKPDPRTNRWGPLRGQTASRPTEVPGEPVDAATSAIRLEEGPSGNLPDVADPDGKKRKDDLAIAGGLGHGQTSMGKLLSNEQPELRNSLPLRPYCTVAELGCVFRDQPWKTLDFATAVSADAALLDYFTINESGPDGVVAGKLNLNAAGSTLDALLSQAALEIGHSAVLGAVTGIADAIGPDLMSPADLPGEIPTNPSAKTKAQQEAAIRALGTAGQTRTWNFFIDLIAQSGKLQPGSTELTDFFSEGESRFWMHVAIDRFTGRVIGSQVEAYQE